MLPYHKELSRNTKKQRKNLYNNKLNEINKQTLKYKRRIKGLTIGGNRWDLSQDRSLMNTELSSLPCSLYTIIVVLTFPPLLPRTSAQGHVWVTTVCCLEAISRAVATPPQLYDCDGEKWEIIFKTHFASPVFLLRRPKLHCKPAKSFSKTHISKR